MTLKQRFSQNAANNATTITKSKLFFKNLGVAVLLMAGSYTASAQAAHIAPGELRAKYDKVIEQAAHKNHIDSNLLRAVITVESGYKRGVVSHAGAVGLMQLLPSTAHRFGARNVYDPVQNIHAGARYISYLMNMFKHNSRLAIAAYNAGEGSVIKSGYRVPAFSQTRAYVPKVLSLWQGYKNIY
jgi:soluble lytic murein transglycosylase-like protein